MIIARNSDFDQGVPPIVVGVSPSTYSPFPLRWAAAEAEYRHAPLHAVMAWRPPRPPAAPASRPPAVLISTAEELQTEAVTALERAVTEVLGDTQGVLLRVVRGSTSAVLLAATEGAQLLVLGASHPGRVSALRDRLRPPSIAYRVTCPVVLIPPLVRKELISDRSKTTAETS